MNRYIFLCNRIDKEALDVKFFTQLNDASLQQIPVFALIHLFSENCILIAPFFSQQNYNYLCDYAATDFYGNYSTAATAIHHLHFLRLQAFHPVPDTPFQICAGGRSTGFNNLRKPMIRFRTSIMTLIITATSEVLPSGRQILSRLQLT